MQRQNAGIQPYTIALTALAAGTSWPDLVASKIAAERQITADSAIANITCRFLSLSQLPSKFTANAQSTECIAGDDQLCQTFKIHSP